MTIGPLQMWSDLRRVELQLLPARGEGDDAAAGGREDGGDDAGPPAVLVEGLDEIVEAVLAASRGLRWSGTELGVEDDLAEGEGGVVVVDEGGVDDLEAVLGEAGGRSGLVPRPQEAFVVAADLHWVPGAKPLGSSPVASRLHAAAPQRHRRRLDTDGPECREGWEKESR